MSGEKIKRREFTVNADSVGMRVDKYITMELGEGASRSYVKFLMDNGFARLNGAPVKPHRSVHEGDSISLELVPLPEETDMEPENIPLKILYEDEWILVVDKPAGMVVHPGAGNSHGTLANALLYHCGQLPVATEGNRRPGIVHRLDKDTSGVIVVAKNDRALRSLAKQFQKRATKKCYIVVVTGRVEMDNGVIDVPVARSSTDRRKMSVRYAGGKESRTVYHVLRRFGACTLMRVEPHTGRTHQIRVHMKYLGHPVVGDTRYGGSGGISRQALHAETLGFTHPDTGKYMEFSAPIPSDIEGFIKKVSSE